ncbi:MAG: competence/damage-inducible protein A [Hyphomicrobiales bacterium]|nr:MAG: competence/damage-inducible protein A [Hyphomicrobiales bacterium]
MTASHPSDAAPSGTIVTAAILVIGDEILSGRTKDKNIGFIAEYCTNIGIDLKEVRIVPDENDRIVDAINELRARYTYLFTTGGIGPTHDDITADAVAEAFDTTLEINDRIVEIMKSRRPGYEITPARLRMARVPKGGGLIENTVSGLPGFYIGNVYVMAGVPSVMQAMFDALVPMLRTGDRILSETIDAGRPESVISAPLGAIQEAHPDTMIGSYPYFEEGRFATRIVVRARDAALLKTVAGEVEAMLDTLPKTDKH